ncbi:NAD-dependent epimerase/dehydratase family protein [Pareuzebyella sediminis]|uniref:NAD-dependent epimerase/dehydratase family protein n=1 Tax=Pareuzebyella sediminis TaxID=2607998 RepID=UPI0011EC13F1|nr:NAD-dependent epimerase/dehydratase family protein [Pareuzebyella sediminis]
MQTILGSGGIIATELAKSLLDYTSDIRLVSRNPKKVNPGDHLLPMDLTEEQAVYKAVEGSSIVYVTIGFPYSAKVWSDTWPKFMKNVISACKRHKAKMVFFDNVYMYDRNHLNGMNEETPLNPTSKKGQIRLEVLQMIDSAIKAGTIDALVARCADYYGPGITRNGMLRELVFDNLFQGKKAKWLESDKYPHSFTYTKDASKATALLGNTEEAFGQVWHLPTAKNPYTGKEWIEKIAEAMGKSPRYRVVSKFMVKIIGWFVPIMREVVEMMYQYDRDYVFNSDKFEKAFNFVPTTYEKGIQQIVIEDYS